MITHSGQAIRFGEDQVRAMGRATQGVRGVKLADDDAVVGMDLARDDAQLLVITENGYGKRTPLNEYRTQARGGKGVFTLKSTDRNGMIVSALVVKEGEEIMVISHDGIIIRLKVDDVSSMSRTTQGVTLMRMGEGDTVVAMARVVSDEN